MIVRPGHQTTELEILRCSDEIQHAKETSTREAQNPKIASIESLRFLACLGIIWFHVKAPAAAVGYGGLPALMAVSVSLAARPNLKRHPWSVVLRRAERLLVPWLFWSAVYIAVKLVSVLAGQRPFIPEFTPSMILIGGELHLWYLPFAFVATSAVAVWVTAHSIGKAALIWAAVCAGALTICSWCMAHVNLYAPFAQWVFVAPSVFLGMAMANTIRQPDRKNAVIVATTVFSACAVNWVIGWHALAVPYAAGAISFTLATFFRRTAGPFATAIGGLSYGIYILHPLATSMCTRLLHVQTGATLAFVVIGVSVASTALARLTIFRKVL